MPRKPQVPALSAVPAGVAPGQPLFGARPLIPGEDAAAYDELIARVSAHVKPADIVEEQWVRDVVDLFWEALRLRRHKAKAIAAAAPRALAHVLAPLLYIPPEPGLITVGVGAKLADELANRWAARERNALREVDVLLADAGLTIDDVMARCLTLELDEVERIDRMTMHVEIRRNAALREIERHRAATAAAIRRAIEDVEDAEFAEIRDVDAPAAQLQADGRGNDQRSIA